MKNIIMLIVTALILLTQSVHAYKLFPNGTERERKIANLDSGLLDNMLQWSTHKGILHFSEPVHEEIINRIYWCNDDCDNKAYADPDGYYYIMAGVRWNDDPPFILKSSNIDECVLKVSKVIRLVTEPTCWKQLYDEAEKKGSKGKYDAENSQDNLMQRSHFGDLQFLHTMASKDGESAKDTKRKIMMWAEFTWRVGTDEYKLNKFLKDVKIDGFDKFFGKTEWRVQDLFTLGNPDLRRPGGVRQVAFGSLLHMLQDSFSEAHTLRREGVIGEVCPDNSPKPGVIVSFYSYQNQNHGEHQKRDSSSALSVHLAKYTPTVVDIGKRLAFYMENMDPPASWEMVEPYLSCIFDIENPDAEAIPGDGELAR